MLASLTLCSADDPESALLRGTSARTMFARNGAASLFEDRIEFTVQTHAANPVCQTTLVLIVDRDADVEGAGGALLVVDSMDFAIAAPSSGSFR